MLVLARTGAAPPANWTLKAHTFAYGQMAPITSSAIDTTGSHLLIVAGNGFYGEGPLAITDSQNNTWLVANTADEPGSRSRLATSYVRYPVTSTAHTFTMGINVYPVYASFGIIAFVNPSIPPLPVDQTNALWSTVEGSTFQAGPITPSTDGDLIIAATMPNNGVAAPIVSSIDSGLVITDQFPGQGGGNIANAFAVAWLEQAVAALINPTWTYNSTITPNLRGATIISFLSH